MTKKDYARIAAALSLTYRETSSAEGQRAIVRVALNIADELDANNPRFDSQRFIAAAIPPKRVSPSR